MKKLFLTDYTAAVQKDLNGAAELIMGNAINEAANGDFVTYAEVKEQIVAYYNMFCNPCTEDVEDYKMVKAFLEVAAEMNAAIASINALAWGE